MRHQSTGIWAKDDAREAPRVPIAVSGSLGSLEYATGWDVTEERLQEFDRGGLDEARLEPRKSETQG